MRESEIKTVNNQLNKIAYHWSTCLKQKVIANIIPPRLEESVQFGSIEKVGMLVQTMQRTMLMVRNICEKQMPNVNNMYSGNDDEDVEKRL